MSEKPTYEELEQRIREFEQAGSDRERVEAQYRGIFEASKDTFLIFDMDGVLREVNPAACEMYGYSHDEMIGLTGKDIVHPDYQYLFKEFVKKAAEGRIFSAESVDIRKDGSSFHIEVRGSGLTYNGEPHLLAVVRDITEHKRMEEALRAERERFKSLSDNAPFGMVMIAKDGTFRHINPKFCELFGYDLSDIPNGRTWFRKAYPDPDYRHKVISTWVEDLVSSEVGEKRPREFEVECKDGSKKIVNFTPVQLETEENLMACVDITDRKQAEEAMRESEEKYRSIFEDSRDAIYITTRNGKFIDANQAALDLFGYSREEMASVNALQLYANTSDAVGFQKDIEKNGFLRDYEVTFYKKDGTEIDCLLNTTMRRANDGKIQAYQGIIRDITEQKRLEERINQVQRLEAIGTLAGGVAHDFNNLLMGIQGNASLMLLDTDKTHGHYEKLKKIEQYVQNGSDLTKQLLGFGRGGKYEVKPTDLNDMVKKSSEMFGRTKKEINIYPKYEENIWTVEADQSQIEQVLLNLYVNAWQAMPKGGTLYLQTENITLDEDFAKPFSVEAGRYAKISVKDTGVGMDEATQQRIFDPFFTTKELGRGTGLGLASAYGIIKNHDGIITVYSKKGEGTTFSIYLPATEKTVSVKQELAEEILMATETVLLVDDEEMIIDVGAQMLKKMGYEIFLAMNGKEALGVYKKNQDNIDMVILDMIMPDMGGGEVFDRLKEINPDVKVLLSSGYSIDGQATEILKRGCDGFIQKPFNMKNLSQKLREILDK